MSVWLEKDVAPTMYRLGYSYIRKWSKTNPHERVEMLATVIHGEDLCDMIDLPVGSVIEDLFRENDRVEIEIKVKDMQL
jgi:hypothetical protein